MLRTSAAATTSNSFVNRLAARPSTHGGERAFPSRGEEDVSRRRVRTREQEWDFVRRSCGAGPEEKLFVLGGRDGACSFPGMREALLARGWIEHQEFESPAFDLKWCLKTSDIDFARLHTGGA